MARMHWWIMAVGAVFFLWFFIPAFVVVNIGNITGMAVSALVLLYGIFYRQVQDVAGRLWQTRGGRAGLSATLSIFQFIFQSCISFFTIYIIYHKVYNSIISNYNQ